MPGTPVEVSGVSVRETESLTAALNWSRKRVGQVNIEEKDQIIHDRSRYRRTISTFIKGSGPLLIYKESFLVSLLLDGENPTVSKTKAHTSLKGIFLTHTLPSLLSFLCRDQTLFVFTGQPCPNYSPKQTFSLFFEIKHHWRQCSKWTLLPLPK